MTFRVSRMREAGLREGTIKDLLAIERSVQILWSKKAD